mmetsp:Transcript_1781/g.6576  ORF Transcript_1781/g.6576 Transcript_1781/m.6576 type:complete len:212 (-) Transcript_1781:282-917(-)
MWCFCSFFIASWARFSLACFFFFVLFVPLWKALYTSSLDTSSMLVSSSLSTSESTSSCPMKNLSAATVILGLLWNTALATTFTVFASDQILRWYIWVRTHRDFLALSSLSSPTIEYRKFWIFLLSLSSLCFALLRCRSATMWLKICFRRSLSWHRNSLKSRGRSSWAVSRPRFLTRIRAWTRDLRSMASKVVACFSSRSMSSPLKALHSSG